jgi:hypothetical protein
MVTMVMMVIAFQVSDIWEEEAFVVSGGWVLSFSASPSSVCGVSAVKL